MIFVAIFFVLINLMVIAWKLTDIENRLIDIEHSLKPKQDKTNPYTKP